MHHRKEGTTRHIACFIDGCFKGYSYYVCEWHFPMENKPSNVKPNLFGFPRTGMSHLIRHDAIDAFLVLPNHVDTIDDNRYYLPHSHGMEIGNSLSHHLDQYGLCDTLFHSFGDSTCRDYTGRRLQNIGLIDYNAAEHEYNP